MKKLLPIVLSVFSALPFFGQTVIYNQDFNGVSVPDLPGDWFATSDQIFTNASSPSSGYSGASGSNNLLSRNCNPNNQVRSFQVDGIASTGYEGLTVSFGHRRTNSFTPPVTLEWSSDGSSWNSITYNSASAGTTWALFTSATLPAGANNQPSLSFRWTYTTSVGNVPCDNFAGNYRLDDFKVTAATVLPVRLIHFTGFLEDKSVLLSWRTATETSNDFFSIERSADGRNFTETGRVQGRGTTTEPQNYRFSDDNPLPGLNYYRLRQVDFDGQFSYSKVVSVQVGGASGARLYPSPATDFLTIQMEKPALENTVWEIFDLAGRLLQSGEFLAENPDFQINVAALPEGLHHLRLSAGQSVSTLRFLKN